MPPESKLTDLPGPPAETALELPLRLAHPFLGEFYDGPDADRARRKHLEDLATMLPWMARIDASV